jgi:hypothetical protein
MSAFRNVERVLLSRDEWDRMRFLFVAAHIISVNLCKIDCFNKPYKQLIKVQMVVFWNVTPCSWVGRCQNFGGPLFSLEQKRQEGWQYEEAERTTYRHVTLHTVMSHYVPSCHTTYRHVTREAVFLVTETHTSNVKQSIKILLICLRL